MRLVTDDMLDASPVVANCQMNRERNLCGSNGYESDLRFDTLKFLREAARCHGDANWLDLCCGRGMALVEAARIADNEGLPLQIVGVDLAGVFVTIDSKKVVLHDASLNNWKPVDRFNLITCVHGLHYIGDKLGLIARAAGWLKDDGRLLANLDMANIQLDGKPSSRIVTSALRQAGFEYSSRHKLIHCDGRKECDLKLRYLGADDQAGPNYTGQPAVNSYYESRG